MDERRGLPRWQVKRRARAWLPETKQFDDCIIEDINLKGMCASFTKRLPQQQPVRLSLGLDGSPELMEIEVQVAWGQEKDSRFVYGLCFSKIQEWDKEKINQYITNHCSEQFKQKWWATA